MSRLTSATCPRCGAQVQPAPGSEQATCNYCGTVSFVARPQAAPVYVPVVVSKSNGPLLFIALGLGFAVLAGVGLTIYLLTQSSPAPSAALVSPSLPTATVAPSPVPASAPTEAAPSAPPIKILNDFAPLVADIDTDGSDDVLVALSTPGASGTTEHYAAFSGRSGRELSRTAAIEDRSSQLPTIVGRRLIAASRAGQLTSYGLGNGSQQWTTALGARVTAFCAAKSADSLLVSTDEHRQLAIDLTTGRQSETREPCTTVLAREGRGGSDPRDRHDYNAPSGTESYYCGGVTVMGSENYTVEDQCRVRAHIDSDHLDRLNGSRLWKVAQDWLVFGVRQPGTRVPMVGLVSHGRLAWKAEIPLDNPLEAQEGSPDHVGLASSLVVAAYTTNKARSTFVTAFNVSDGSRRWTTPLPQRVTSIAKLKTSFDRVFISAGDELFLLNAADGKLLVSLGQHD